MWEIFKRVVFSHFMSSTGRLCERQKRTLSFVSLSLKIKKNKTNKEKPVSHVLFRQCHPTTRANHLWCFISSHQWRKPLQKTSGLVSVQQEQQQQWRRWRRRPCSTLCSVHEKQSGREKETRVTERETEKWKLSASQNNGELK